MNITRKLLAATCLALVASASACAKPRADHGAGEAVEPGKEAFGKLTMDELDARMSDAKAGKIKLAVFDNNQHERFVKGHLPGASWVKFDDVKASDLPADKETTLVFYCSNEH